MMINVVSNNMSKEELEAKAQEILTNGDVRILLNRYAYSLEHGHKRQLILDIYELLLKYSTTIRKENECKG